MRRTILASLILAQGTLLAAANEAASPSIAAKVDNFSLRDASGGEHSLADFAKKPVVVLAFLGTECPLAKLYVPRLAELAAQYEPRGVAFVGIDSNRQDAATEIAAFARRHGIAFPLLKDLGNELADRVGAQRTPEVFVLDGERKVRYHGRIDDQYGFKANGSGYQLAEPHRRDLAIALDELLAGKAVSVPTSAIAGCLIGRVKQPAADSDVTYTNQIARILNTNCVFCHREGQLAPFALTSYDEVVGWAEMIREVVDERRMPPWHADPRYGHFVNDARLSDADRELIARWVERGAPQGRPEDLPEAPKFAEGWMIPEPDQVIFMRDEPFDVPAQGVVDYQRFIVDPGWTEDKWIKAIEPKAGNPAVVHHVVMYLMAPGAPKKGAAGRLRNDWLAAYAPGLRPQILPDDYARYVPAGSKLVFELHYTPNGTAQTDRSYLGLVYADPKKVKKELAVKNAGNFSFIIPPGEDNYQVESEFVFRQDTLLWSLSPHMHLRGKDFLYTAVFPDGREETLLSVPHYDFGWQTTYVMTEPKLMPKGSKLHCVAHFDNSDGNLNNPDPTAKVRWGEQTWQEMMFGWFEMALADQDLTVPQSERPTRVSEFLAAAQAGGAKIDEQLGEAMRKALDSDEKFKFFAYYLAEQVPQLDRICITYVEDGELHARAVEELNGLRTILRTQNTVLSAKDQPLAEYATVSAPVVVEDLSQLPGSIAKKMTNRGVVSSLHVPESLAGRKVTVSFWSTEAKAFPPQAVELLTKVADAIVAGR